MMIIIHNALFFITFEQLFKCNIYYFPLFFKRCMRDCTTISPTSFPDMKKSYET